MSEHVEPCGWCGKQPEHNTWIAYCRTPECVNFAIVSHGREAWNARQERILASRRADFEAGREHWMDYDDVCFQHSDFDDYIAGDK